MKFSEAMKIILCDSKNGIHYDKAIKGENYKISFEEQSCSDCSIICIIYFSSFFNEHNIYTYRFDYITTNDTFCEKPYVTEKKLNEFLKKHYLFKNEEVEIINE